MRLFFICWYTEDSLFHARWLSGPSTFYNAISFILMDADADVRRQGHFSTSDKVSLCVSISSLGREQLSVFQRAEYDCVLELACLKGHNVQLAHASVAS